jgi:hypothetical protein
MEAEVDTSLMEVLNDRIDKAGEAEKTVDDDDKLATKEVEVVET